MKTPFAKFFLFVGMVLTANAVADPVPAFRQVTVGISDVYVPQDINANNDAIVIASGMFPNSCYSWTRVDVTSPTPLFHEVRAIANVAQQMCLMVMISYQKEMDLGRFEPGNHTLRFINGDGTYFEKTLVVN
jgi:hypothetical protein